MTGPLTEPQIAFVCRETLQGLCYLHRRGKMHRDIKVLSFLFYQCLSHLSVHLSASLSVCMSICVCLSVFVSQSVCLSVCLSLSQSLSLSHSHTCTHAHTPHTHTHIHTHTHTHIHIHTHSLSLALSLSLFLSLSLYLSFSLSLSLSNPFLGHFIGLVVKASALKAKIPGSNPTCAGTFSGSSLTSDFKIGTPVATLPGAWRYRVSATTGLPVSVCCDWVRWKVWPATFVSVWQHVKLSEQIRPWDTLACCWDV